MTMHDPRDLMIVGQTADGRRFRPSDWAERLGSMMAHLGARQSVTYSPWVRPGYTPAGLKCLHVAARLHELEPRAYEYLLGFARQNDLQIHTS